MTETTFYRCVYHETKRAYTEWLKYIFIGIGLTVGFTIGYYTWDNGSGILAAIITQSLQFTYAVPWYISLCGLILLLPVSFATGYCVRKRINNLGHETVIATILFSILLISIITSMAIKNIFLVSIGFLGFMFVVGMVHIRRGVTGGQTP